MDAPAWLDREFISSILQTDLKEEVDVSNMKITSAVPPGNNYFGDIYRVSVEFKVKSSTNFNTVSLIVKAPVIMEMPEPSDHPVPEEFDLFAKEPKIYEQLLPKMNERVKCEFGPKFYPCLVKNTVVLQDLKEEGYVMKSRFNQLDLEHCRHVFKTLAKFHAASLACMKENPGLKNLGLGPPLDDEHPLPRKMRSGLLYSARRVAEITKDMEECKGFSEHILSRVDHLWKSFTNMFTLNEEKFNVMTHGDLWTTNVMFKYNARGEIENLKLLDYQLTRFGSPVSDLVLFTWTSANQEVLKSHQEDLNNEYLDTLNGTLKDLGCNERYSPEEFQQELKESADKVLSLIVNHLAVLLADPKDGVFKLDALDPETENGRQLFEKLLAGKYYRRVLPSCARQYLAWVSSI